MVEARWAREVVDSPSGKRSTLPPARASSMRLAIMPQGLGWRAAGAGCTVGAEGKDRAWPVVPFEEEAAASDLKARTSRAISRQVMNSV
jgi:hypothetical protein